MALRPFTEETYSNFLESLVAWQEIVQHTTLCKTANCSLDNLFS